MAGRGWNVGNPLFLAFLLVCPISMFWMMRRGGGSRVPAQRMEVVLPPSRRRVAKTA